MKKLFFVLLLLAVVLAFSSQSVIASGDKVRGDKSEGPSYQLGECPFTG